MEAQGKLPGMKDKRQSTPQNAPADRPSKKLERLGGVITMSELCTSTASGVRADYEQLSLDIRKAGQWARRKRSTQSAEDLLPAMKRDFSGSLLVGDEVRPGYFYDSELLELIDKPGQSPSKLAISKMADRTMLSEATVRTYSKRRGNRKIQKHQRKNPLP
jgi:hypothetical protein